MRAKTEPHPPNLPSLLLAWRQSWELWTRLTPCASRDAVLVQQQTSQLSLFASETQYFEHNLNTSIPFLNILLQFLTNI